MAARPGTPAREMKRDAIVEAAAGLFARRGYRATSLDDVAEALDIKKASLYHYIRSKEEILLETYERIFTRIEAAVTPHAATALPADERLRRMVHAHLEVVTAERDMLAVVFREESELPAGAQAGIRRRKRAYERLFEGVIEEGQAGGVLRPLTARLAVLALLGMCNWTYQWFEPGAWSADEVAGEFTLLLEQGWRAGDGHGRRGVWPRPESPDEALAPVAGALERLRSELAAAAAELDRGTRRLRDGLAQSPPGPG